MSDLVSRPFRPDPEHCCEACVFGRGEHAPWCPHIPHDVDEESRAERHEG